MRPSRMPGFFLSVSPTFYAVVSGGLIGAVINLLTSILFATEVKRLIWLLFCSLGLLIAAILLLCVGVRLEDICSKAASSERKQAMIRQHKELFYYVQASVVLSILAVLGLVYATQF